MVQIGPEGTSFHWVLIVWRVSFGRERERERERENIVKEQRKNGKFFRGDWEQRDEYMRVYLLGTGG